jgi:hypothetical protein
MDFYFLLLVPVFFGLTLGLVAFCAHLGEKP